MCKFAEFECGAADILANGRSHARELALAAAGLAIRLKQSLFSLRATRTGRPVPNRFNARSKLVCTVLNRHYGWVFAVETKKVKYKVQKLDVHPSLSPQLSCNVACT